MKREGLTVAVILLFIGLAASPTIYAERDNQTTQIMLDKNVFNYNGFNPIQLVFLLIHKLLNHEKIKTVESVDDVEQLVEHDAELSGIVERLKDCNCDDDSTLEKNFLDICELLFIPYLFCLFVNLYLVVVHIKIGHILWFIGESLICWWTQAL